VSSFNLRRLTAVISAASLALMVLGAGVAQASAPAWIPSEITELPPTVGPGTDAGYSFSVTNNGPSNISSLYLLGTLPQPAVYAAWQVTTGGAMTGQGTCPTNAQLKCTIGALNAGQTASFLIAYAVGTSSLTASFQANTTGSIINPNGHNHGDLLQWSATTSVSNSKDFAGGFQLGDGNVFDNQTLGPKNVQGTTVNSFDPLIPVTVQDGATVSFPCVNCGSAHLFGEWSDVSVKGGQPTSGFKVVLLIRGSELSGSPDLSTIYVEHTSADGSTTTQIRTQCDSATSKPTNIGTDGCILVSKVGSNIQIIVWLITNGGLKGAI
jgi:Domain of unknown function DUF11